MLKFKLYRWFKHLMGYRSFIKDDPGKPYSYAIFRGGKEIDMLTLGWDEEFVDGPTR